MADWLIQRLDLSGPADADGVWVDEGVVVDVPVSDSDALRVAVERFVLARKDLGAPRRVSNWSTTHEFALAPSATSAVVQAKSVRTRQ